MTHIQAEDWLRELQKGIQNEHLTQQQAYEEVLAELSDPDADHDRATETLYFNFTRG
jgi:hypothetical protein